MPLANSFAILILCASCRQEAPAPPPQNNPPATIPLVKTPEVLVFPQDLRVADESVNAFVERAMKTCSTGNYDEFRSLWSAQRDPLPRSEFDQGWQAVKTIRVRALQKIILGQEGESEAKEGEEAYVLFTNLSLDPKHPAGQEDPNRETALLIIRERDDWRLTKAPKQVREWVKQHFAPSKEATPDSADKSANERS